MFRRIFVFSFLHSIVENIMKHPRSKCNDGDDIVRFTNIPVSHPPLVCIFQAHVKQTQLQKFTFDYYMHGLVEEVGEVYEAVSTPHDSVLTYPAHDVKVLLEIGDVLWYVTSFSLEIDTLLVMPETWPTAKAGAVNPEVSMLSTVARLAGRVKKVLRGDKPLDQFAPAMLLYRDELMTRCAEVAANYGTTLQKCAEMNMRKLNGRSKRGTVCGDGDRR